MAAQPLRPAVDRELLSNVAKNEAYTSAVSWAAVVGGAFVAAALSLILLSLGTGLGFSAISPWSNNGASAAAIGSGAIVWLILTQILASALVVIWEADYEQKRWIRYSSSKAHFRDTAHGLLVWAVGTAITAGFLGILSGLFCRHAEGCGNDRLPSGIRDRSHRILRRHALLRGNASAVEKQDVSERTEVSRIFAHDLHQGTLPSGDQSSGPIGIGSDRTQCIRRGEASDRCLRPSSGIGRSCAKRDRSSFTLVICGPTQRCILCKLRRHDRWKAAESRPCLDSV